jgi:hypothetical protein
VDSAEELEKDAFLHVQVPIDRGRDRLGQLRVKVVLVFHLDYLVSLSMRELADLLLFLFVIG